MHAQSIPHLQILILCLTVEDVAFNKICPDRCGKNSYSVLGVRGVGFSKRLKDSISLVYAFF